jgi:hypothetical protein
LSHIFDFDNITDMLIHMRLLVLLIDPSIFKYDHIFRRIYIWIFTFSAQVSITLLDIEISSVAGVSLMQCAMCSFNLESFFSEGVHCILFYVHPVIADWSCHESR